MNDKFTWLAYEMSLKKYFVSMLMLNENNEILYLN